jgi:hypothetical protein
MGKLVNDRVLMGLQLQEKVQSTCDYLVMLAQNSSERALNDRFKQLKVRCTSTR